MRPLNGKPTRRGMRRARRGVPTGRRATHEVETTYGRHQRDRDWRERFTAAIAAFKASRPEPDDIACGKADETGEDETR